MTTFRTIEQEDLPALGRLYEELMERPTNGLRLEQAFTGIGHNGSYILLGAFEGEELAGSLMGIVCQDLVGECRPFMVIENVIVSGAFRRRGIGRQLLLEIERTAKERGCAYAILVSGGHRVEAHRLYEQLGYKDEQVEGYRKHF